MLERVCSYSSGGAYTSSRGLFTAAVLSFCDFTHGVRVVLLFYGRTRVLTTQLHRAIRDDAVLRSTFHLGGGNAVVVFGSYFYCCACNFQLTPLEGAVGRARKLCSGVPGVFCPIPGTQHTLDKLFLFVLGTRPNGKDALIG